MALSKVDSHPWGEGDNRAQYVARLSAYFLSTSRSGRFSLPIQTVSMRPILTGELIGEPIDNKRFSTTPVEVERGNRARDRQPHILRRKVPVERFEPSTLVGLVFETSAYTVPPHRLVEPILRLIEHGIIFFVSAG